MNDTKHGLAEVELGRLLGQGCIFLAIKVTAEVDESSVVLDIPVDDFESAFLLSARSSTTSLAF